MAADELAFHQDITTEIFRRLPLAYLVQISCVSKSFNSIRNRMVAENLPFDQQITTEIFKRLPAASLVRFTCVSKSFYSLIYSRSFIAAHMVHQQISKITRYIGQVYHINRQFNLGDKVNKRCSIFNETFSSFLLLESPASFPTQSFQLVGTCNGLLCLKYSENLGETGSNICLWNPTIRKVKVLPLCLGEYRLALDSLDCNVDFAFGFDKESFDHKVVRFVYFRHEVRRKKFQVDVYSLCSNSWKRIINGVDCESTVSVHGDSYVSINGVIYWLAAKDRDIKFTPYDLKAEFRTFSHDMVPDSYKADMIASFDLASDMLQDICLPESVSSGPLRNISLAKLCESLALLHLPHGYSQSFMGDEHDIWILRQGIPGTNKHSWTKQYSIFLQYSYDGWFLGPEWWAWLSFSQDKISFTRDGQAILMSNNGIMQSYDLKSNVRMSLGVSGFPMRSLDTFEESLVLLSTRNSVRGFAESSDTISYSFPVCIKQERQGGSKRRKQVQS